MKSRVAAAATVPSALPFRRRCLYGILLQCSDVAFGRPAVLERGWFVCFAGNADSTSTGHGGTLRSRNDACTVTHRCTDSAARTSIGFFLFLFLFFFYSLSFPISTPGVFSLRTSHTHTYTSPLPSGDRTFLSIFFFNIFI